VQIYDMSGKLITTVGSPVNPGILRQISPGVYVIRANKK
jgi:hypothetical protein